MVLKNDPYQLKQLKSSAYIEDNKVMSQVWPYYRASL
jgi:hypothetical protein